MYLTVTQQIRHLSDSDCQTIRELCHYAKNLTNEAIYNVRQVFQNEGKILKYADNYALLKNSTNYKALNSNMAQQIIKEVDSSFKSFFGLLKLAKKNQYPFQACRLPCYLPKNGYSTLIIGFVRLNGNKLILPFSNEFKKTHDSVEITIPPILADKKVKEIKIIPKSHGKFFEIQYTYEVECIERNLDKSHVLALDLGINNLVAAVSSDGKSFIIDGKKLKSVNQWFNRENARLKAINDKQHFGKHTTNRQKAIARKRNNQVNDYLNKAARLVIDYCIENNIGTLVVGCHEITPKSGDKSDNAKQNFVVIPLGKLRTKLEYLCKLNHIDFVKQEESYTSQASFWDKDDISAQAYFSGQRLHRGLYRTADGQQFNADVNGALNILRKSNVVSLDTLYSRGAVDTPARIRVT